MKNQQVTTRTASVLLVDDVRDSPVDTYLGKARRRVFVAVLIAILLVVFIAFTR